MEINNIELTNNKKKLGLEVQCFKCDSFFRISYVNRYKRYSEKNNWGYWTEKEENKDKYICSLCIRKMYFDNYAELCETVNQKKRNTMRTYFNYNLL